MMLSEETAVATADLPVQALRDHLRLATGFAGSGLQDGLLVSHLRAAMTTIEARTGKVLLARRFRLVLGRWRDPCGLALPVAPVSAVVSVVLTDAAGTEVAVAADRYRLMPDGHRPRLLPVGASLPSVPEAGQVAVTFDAGFGSTWAEVPADLAQAVLLLAAELYERRHDGGTVAGGLPFGVQLLIERWRTVRVLGGR